MISLNVSHSGDVVAVQVAGSIDALTCAPVEAALNEQLAAGRRHVVLDLAGVDFTSSTGLRMILAAAKEARRQGGDLRLSGMQPAVARVLSISGFLGLLKTFPDRESAVASYAG